MAIQTTIEVLRIPGTLFPRGAFDENASYKFLNIVESGGNGYVCLQPCTGIPVTNTAYWFKFVFKGDKGDAFTYADLTAEQKAELVRDATAAAQAAASSAQSAADDAAAALQKFNTIKAAIDALDPTSTEGSIQTLAAKQGLLEADLAALGQKVDGTLEINEQISAVKTYDDTTIYNNVNGLSWYINEQNNDIRTYDYATNDCPEVLAIKVYPVVANEEYSVVIPKLTNYYPNAKRCIGFNASSESLTSISSTDGTKHNGGTRTITYTPSADGFIFVSYASKSKDGLTTYDAPTVTCVTGNAIKRIDSKVAELDASMEGISETIDNTNELLGSTDFSDDASVTFTGKTTSVNLSDESLYIVQSNGAKITISMANLSWDSSYKWTLLRIKALRSNTTVVQKEWVNPGREGSQESIEYNVISSSISFSIKCQKGDQLVVANRLSANFTVSVEEDAIYYKKIDDIEERLAIVAPSYTHEYYGERIILPKWTFDYSIVGRNIINGKASVDGGALASQGMCIYGDYMFNFFNCGYVQIHDFNNNYAIVGEYKLDIYATSHGTHANCVSFGIEEGTLFPYAYLMDGYWRDVLVEDLTLTGSTLVQTISLDWAPTNTQLQAIVGDDGYLYVMALLTASSTDKEIKIRRYRLPLISEGATVTLTDDDCQGEWGIYFDYTNDVEGTNGVIQGGKIFNGKLFLARGSRKDNCQKVEVYDTGSFSLLTTVPLHGVIGEPEDLDFHDGKMYIVGHNQYMAWELSF